MSTTIEDRVALVLAGDDQPYGYWTALERATNIDAARWRKVAARTQRPTPDMLQALCRAKPEYAFWIATGITDAENGHTAPSTAFTYPEMPRRHWRSPAASKYFAESLDLQAQLFERLAHRSNDEDVGIVYDPAPLNDDEYRLKLVKRELYFRDWRANDSLLACALEVANTDQYRLLPDIQEQRMAEKHDEAKDEIGTVELGDPGPVEHRAVRRLEHQGLFDLFYKAIAKKKR